MPGRVSVFKLRRSAKNLSFGTLRPKHWVKNGFVLASLIFTGTFLDAEAFGHVLWAMLLFCAASSATYTLNDMHDVERDRRHPQKSKTWPLAARTVSVTAALLLLGGLCIILVWGWFAAPKVGMVIALYLVRNLAYMFVLKHQPVIDIFTIAIGFVLRVYAGAMALDVPVSSWMFITTLCSTLYLAAVKRRQELSQNGADGRKVLEKYSVSLIDRYAEMSATGALLFLQHVRDVNQAGAGHHNTLGSVRPVSLLVCRGGA